MDVDSKAHIVDEFAKHIEADVEPLEDGVGPLEDDVEPPEDARPTKKYAFTGKSTRAYPDVKLFRIVALRSFGDVNAGDLGGYIEGEPNLSHEGDAWVYGEARVWNDARVCDNARVVGDACVKEGAHILNNAIVMGDAHIGGCARVRDDAVVGDSAVVIGRGCVEGNARVEGDAFICNDASVGGNATVRGRTRLENHAHILGDAVISENNDLMVVSPRGLWNQHVSIFRDKNIGVRVVCGEYSGSLNEFAQWVSKAPDYNVYAQEVEAFIALARIRFADALASLKQQEDTRDD
jgi:carbonic anhydrase/acetyltransferase-like protein (isoleucine patch superfamily)